MGYSGLLLSCQVKTLARTHKNTYTPIRPMVVNGTYPISARKYLIGVVLRGVEEYAMLDGALDITIDTLDCLMMSGLQVMYLINCIGDVRTRQS